MTEETSSKLRTQVHEKLIKMFDIEELKSFVSKHYAEFERYAPSGASLNNYALAFVQFCERREWLTQLASNLENESRQRKRDLLPIKRTKQMAMLAVPIVVLVFFGVVLQRLSPILISASQLPKSTPGIAQFANLPDSYAQVTPTANDGIIASPSSPPAAPTITPSVQSPLPPTNTAVLTSIRDFEVKTKTPNPRNLNGCPNTSSEAYSLIATNGTHYKANKLSDNNPDFRLSLLGFNTVGEPKKLVRYGKPPNDVELYPPQLSTLFGAGQSAHKIVATYQVRGWKWDEQLEPPYGLPTDTKNDTYPWQVTAIALEAKIGNAVLAPYRSKTMPENETNEPMVIFADENEITLAYSNSELVGDHQFVVHLLNLCVDPNLVVSYRAQLSTTGKRSSKVLPIVRTGQKIAVASSANIIIAIRHSGGYLDPRSDLDFWRNLN